MRIVGVIPARYKSSRFPGKPLANICGKPMLWWVYQQCKKVKEFDEVYIATDDKRIFDTCTEFGMNVMMTSENHMTGTDRMGEVAKTVYGDLYVNIQGDEPLVSPDEIQDLLEIFKDETVYFGSLRQEITDEDELYSSSTVKIVVDYKQDALYMSRSVIPSNIKDGIKTKFYKHIGIYGFKRDFLFKYLELPQSSLELGEGVESMRAIENGYKMRVFETKHKGIGVDLPEHIQLVERELRKRGFVE